MGKALLVLMILNQLKGLEAVLVIVNNICYKSKYYVEFYGTKHKQKERLAYYIDLLWIEYNDISSHSFSTG